MVTRLAERICQAVHAAEWFTGPPNRAGDSCRRPYGRTEACHECSHAAGAVSVWLLEEDRSELAQRLMRVAHRRGAVLTPMTTAAVIASATDHLAKEALS